eukprot:TRINITY_DN142_c0_g1_i1.p3 TRINITY_DN142_c0_g1~~TRINITY_DN142_c0_g1_i1.p3  ORF type:complete len:220 (-),score=40.35 TRINITY_DN142_c0_g1_i1:860-1519(-)
MTVRVDRSRLFAHATARQGRPLQQALVASSTPATGNTNFAVPASDVCSSFGAYAGRAGAGGQHHTTTGSSSLGTNGIAVGRGPGVQIRGVRSMGADTTEGLTKPITFAPPPKKTSDSAGLPMMQVTVSRNFGAVDVDASPSAATSSQPPVSRGGGVAAMGSAAEGPSAGTRAAAEVAWPKEGTRSSTGDAAARTDPSASGPVREPTGDDEFDEMEEMSL